MELRNMIYDILIGKILLKYFILKLIIKIFLEEHIEINILKMMTSKHKEKLLQIKFD